MPRRCGLRDPRHDETSVAIHDQRSSRVVSALEAISTPGPHLVACGVEGDGQKIVIADVVRPPRDGQNSARFHPYRTVGRVEVAFAFPEQVTGEVIGDQRRLLRSAVADLSRDDDVPVRTDRETMRAIPTIGRVFVRARPELGPVRIVSDGQQPLRARPGRRSRHDHPAVVVDEQVRRDIVALLEPVLQAIPEEFTGGVPGEGQEVPEPVVPNGAGCIDVAVRTHRHVQSRRARVDQAAVPPRLPPDGLRSGRGGGETGRQNECDCSREAARESPGPERLHGGDPSRTAFVLAGMDTPAGAGSR